MRAGAGAVGAVLRVVVQPSGGVEEPQEVEARLVAVEAAIEVEDAVCPVAVAEDVEASDSTLISIRCDVVRPPSITRFSCHARYSYLFHFAPSPSLITSWTQQMSAALPYKPYQVR